MGGRDCEVGYEGVTQESSGGIVEVHTCNTE